jgi:hypothetical protein
VRTDGLAYRAVRGAIGSMVRTIEVVGPDGSVLLIAEDTIFERSADVAVAAPRRRTAADG